VREHQFESDAGKELEGGDQAASLILKQAQTIPLPHWHRARQQNAVSRFTGFGKSFSAAAVITPNVPSAPMKSCFKS